MFDLDAYLERIGLSGRPAIAEVHRAHVAAIPFENLDPHRGVVVSLASEDIERKLVGERRGGYCFEQNLLLKAALESLGAEVETFLARVRLGAPPGVVRPRGHAVLRVRHEGAEWHADAGFGLGTQLEPLPWGPGAEHEQSGWGFRIVRDGPELVLQTAGQEGEWVDVYGLVPEPLPRVDLETSNLWVSTHPHSPFVTGLIVSAQSAEGTRTTLSDWGKLDGAELELMVQTPAERTMTPVARAQAPELLERRFGLSGFALGANGRIVPG